MDVMVFVTLGFLNVQFKKSIPSFLVMMNLLVALTFEKMCGYIYWIRIRRLNTILIAIPGFYRKLANLGDFRHRHNLLYSSLATRFKNTALKTLSFLP